VQHFSPSFDCCIARAPALERCGLQHGSLLGGKVAVPRGRSSPAVDACLVLRQNALLTLETNLLVAAKRLSPPIAHAPAPLLKEVFFSAPCWFRTDWKVQACKAAVKLVAHSGSAGPRGWAGAASAPTQFCR